MFCHVFSATRVPKNIAVVEPRYVMPAARNARHLPLNYINHEIQPCHATFIFQVVGVIQENILKYIDNILKYILVKTRPRHQNKVSARY